MAETTNFKFRYPVEGDSPDIPRDMENLAKDIDKLLFERLQPKFIPWAKVATAVTTFEVTPSATRAAFVAFEVEKNSGTVQVTISVGGEIVYKGVAVEGAFPAVQLGLPVNPGQVLKIECTTVGKINVYTSTLLQ
jgi:hypothetical protein